MARLLQQVVKKPLAERILFGDLQAGGMVMADVEGDKIDLRVVNPSA